MSTPETHAELPPKQVSMEYLKELSGGSVEFEIEMIELFIQKVPADVTAIQEAIDNKDIAAIKKCTHKLKSSFSLFSLSQLLLQQEKLDELANLPFSTEEIIAVFSAMKNNLGDVFRELEELLKTDYNA